MERVRRIPCASRPTGARGIRVGVSRRVKGVFRASSISRRSPRGSRRSIRRRCPTPSRTRRSTTKRRTCRSTTVRAACASPAWTRAPHRCGSRASCSRSTARPRVFDWRRDDPATDFLGAFRGGTGLYVSANSDGTFAASTMPVNCAHGRYRITQGRRHHASPVRDADDGAARGRRRSHGRRRCDPAGAIRPCESACHISGRPNAAGPSARVTGEPNRTQPPPG